jgi:hypothetical protein
MDNSNLIFDKGYNERLFSGGLRGWFHLARFKWLARKCAEFKPDTSTVVELGCFDARSIGWLTPAPKSYFGYDAGWEGGLQAGIEKHKDKPTYLLQKCLSPEQLAFPADRKATLVISLETLEHIPPELLLGYLDKLREISSGHVFVSVPNEKGLIFLVKWIMKSLFYPGRETYTASEVFHATIGNMAKVRRDEHKGFDWEQLRDQMAERFDLVKVEGVQFPWLPAALNVQLGMIFRARGGR